VSAQHLGRTLYAGAATRRILIIGSGFGGLGLAIRLKRAGIATFTILEQAASLGGTWRDNSYPGAACDVPSMLYSLSFEQRTDWPRKCRPRRRSARTWKTAPGATASCRTSASGVQVTGARFDDATGTWTVHTAAGEQLTADVLVSGVGQLHHPSVPHIPGLDTFRGEQFHSAAGTTPTTSPASGSV